MKKVYIFMTNGFEEIEALTVVDLLRRAQIDIEMVSIEKDLKITGSHKIIIQADRMFEEVDYSNADMLILPGGPGTENLHRHEGVVRLLKEFHQKEKMLAAICAAPSVLGVNGILGGKNATCYPGYEEKLEGAIYREQPVVRDGNIITARGAGKAIEFACEIIEAFCGKEKAEQVKTSIIY